MDSRSIKRITIFSGHYGSGKTNVAVNYALWLKKEYEKVYLEKIEEYADAVKEGTMTEAQAEEKAVAAATTSAKNMSMQGGYWLWDFGYDCYMPINITIKNFRSEASDLYLFPAFVNEIFIYNYK